MAKRPKDSPFGALAELKNRVRSAPLAPRAKAAPADLPADSTEDDAEVFRLAVGNAAPLSETRRAHIERPRPAPIPRPRVSEVQAEPVAQPTRRADPNDPLALFQEAMAGVTVLSATGRAEIGRKPPRTKSANRISDGEPAALTPKAMPQLALPVDINDPTALFRHVVGDASPLADRNLAALEKPLPPPTPRQRELDEAAALRESIDAPLSFQDRLDIGDEGVYLHDGLPRRVLTDLRRGRWVIQDELDLHGLTRDEARTALSAFLAHALKQGFRCVRLIHGKGLGSPGREPVLKHLSRGWLMQRTEILAFCQARPHDGGEGALMILLRNQKKTS
jgi:DNA-nicking Smr family endonuclease